MAFNIVAGSGPAAGAGIPVTRDTSTSLDLITGAIGLGTAIVNLFNDDEKTVEASRVSRTSPGRRPLSSAEEEALGIPPNTGGLVPINFDVNAARRGGVPTVLPVTGSPVAAFGSSAGFRPSMEVSRMSAPIALPGGSPAVQGPAERFGVQIGDTFLGVQTPGAAAGAGCPSLGSPFAARGMSATPQPFVMANPVTGRLTWFRPAGRPVLWSSDLTSCRRVKKIAARARRAQGGQR